MLKAGKASGHAGATGSSHATEPVREHRGLDEQDWLPGSPRLLKSKSKDWDPAVSALQAGVWVGNAPLEERGSKIPQGKRGATRATRGAVPQTQG